MFLYAVYLLQFFPAGIYCLLIGPPRFESGWLPIHAQTVDSQLTVQHGLEEVPGLVEVLVRAIDGPNKGFVFKATGNSNRDDDGTDLYGGVMYMYSNVNVRVIAPNGYNDNRFGAAIYTGDAPYWRGVNSQRSLRAEVKVRCWSLSSLPAPCFYTNDLHMKAGSNRANDTYKELHHHLARYPSLVKVRARLVNGVDVDWYSDAQGSSLYNLNVMGPTQWTGGLKYSYNDVTVRVWTSSYPGGYLFSREDGWGTDITSAASEGLVEILAWCDIIKTCETRVPFGPLENTEQLQLPLPVHHIPFDFQMISVLVEAVDGPNKGYFFEMAGSAMTNTENVGHPCGYGGLIHAYNTTTLRIWRPDHATGAAICIPDNMGHGTNSQASQNGNMYFRAFPSYVIQPAKEYKPNLNVCSHYRKQKKSTPNSTAAYP